MWITIVVFSFFFFQAEDGIRDWSVTGVQTCALPILRRVLAAISNRRDVGDVTTLANPDVVEQIRAMVQGKDTITTQEALPERSEEHTSELQSLTNIVCRPLPEKKKKKNKRTNIIDKA